MNSSECGVDISPKLNFLEIEIVNWPNPHLCKFADAVEKLTFPTKSYAFASLWS